MKNKWFVPVLTGVVLLIGGAVGISAPENSAAMSNIRTVKVEVDCYEYVRCGVASTTGFVRKDTIETLELGNNKVVVYVTASTRFCASLDMSTIYQSAEYDAVLNSKETTCSDCKDHWE